MVKGETRSGARRKNKGGFTITELMVVLLLLGFVAAVSLPFGLEYLHSGQTQRLHETARSLYLVAQQALTEQRNAGQLPILSAPGEGQPRVLPGEISPQSGAVYWIMGPGEEAQNPLLSGLLAPYLAEHNLQEQAICVEFHPETGLVFAVFYSEVYPTFFYDALSEEPNNIQRFRTSTRFMGVYPGEGGQEGD